MEVVGATAGALATTGVEEEGVLEEKEENEKGVFVVGEEGVVEEGEEEDEGENVAGFRDFKVKLEFKEGIDGFKAEREEGGGMIFKEEKEDREGLGDLVEAEAEVEAEEREEREEEGGSISRKRGVWITSLCVGVAITGG